MAARSAFTIQYSNQHPGTMRLILYLLLCCLGTRGDEIYLIPKGLQLAHVLTSIRFKETRNILRQSYGKSDTDWYRRTVGTYKKNNQIKAISKERLIKTV